MHDALLQLEAEDNATSVTLNTKLMSIQDQVVSYITTSAVNGNFVVVSLSW